MVHQPFCCTLTDDTAPATSPPTKLPTTHAPTKPPTTKPSKIQYTLSFITCSSSNPMLATKPMSVKVQFEFLGYTVQESCTLLPVTLVVKGEVLRPFTVAVRSMGFYMPSAEGMQQKVIILMTCPCYNEVITL